MSLGDILGIKKEESSVTKQSTVQPVLDPALKTIINEIKTYAQTKGLPDALNNILTALAIEDSSAVYWISKSYPIIHQGFIPTDMGYIGLSERYVPKLMYPGDVAIYSLPLEIKSGDIVELINYAVSPTDTSKHIITFYHFLVESFNANGSVNVKSLFPDKKTFCCNKSTDPWKIC